MEHVQRYYSLISEQKCQRKDSPEFFLCADPTTIKSNLHKYMVEDWESITFMGEYIKVFTLFPFSISHRNISNPTQSHNIWKTMIINLSQMIY